ncbi:putative S-layer protein [Paenibacillus sp. 598K]|nr:putative S-layer protein [Paenibacillus sp. 598K]
MLTYILIVALLAPWAGGRSAHAEPVPPIVPLVDEVYDTQVELTFDMPEAAAEVVMEVSEDGTSWRDADTEPLHQYSTNATVSGLQEGTLYYFRLRVQGGVRDGYSETASATTLDYDWRTVGDKGFTGYLRYTSVALSSSGVPYVAYWDAANSGKVVVQRYVNRAWEVVGTEVSAGAASYVSLALDSNDAPYVAYRDEATPLNGATVKKLVDGAWATIGTAGFTADQADSVVLRIGGNNKLYLAFVDHAMVGSSSGKATVMTYDETAAAWTVVGASQFTTGYSVLNVDLAIGADGTPYLAYLGRNPDNNRYLPYVARWDGSAWSDLGGTAVRADEGSNRESVLSLVIHPTTGQPVISYMDNANNRNMAVAAWNGTAWSAVGAASLPQVRTQQMKLAAHTDGTVYLAYMVNDESTRPTNTIGWDGQSWTPVGQPDFSGTKVDDMALALDRLGRPYVSYSDIRNGSSLTVLVYPKPVSNLAAAANGADAVRLSFEPLLDAESYTLEVSENGTDWQAHPATWSGTYPASADLSGLQAGKTYSFRLVVTGGSRRGVSNTATATIPASSGTGSSGSSGPIYIAPPSKTVTLRVVDPQGQELKERLTQAIGQELELTGELRSAKGEQLSLPALKIKDGSVLNLPVLAAGTYQLALYVVAPDGQRLAGRLAALTIDSMGNAVVQAELIDPYGTITDAVTGKTIDGVDVRLYWMDTELNRSKGRTADTEVKLPELPDFPPNRNLNPQLSKDGGQYGWMVFPDGDYYLVGVKDGYVAFDSREDKRDVKHGEDSYVRDGVIHVGVSIVEYSFEMMPEAADEGEHAPYMKGYPDGMFKPEGGITRAELAAILSRVLPQQEEAGTVANYADVPGMHWAARSIATASAQEWMRGYSDGNFQPERQVTRAELAQVLANVSEAEAADAVRFADAARHWASSAIAAVDARGLMTGYPDGTFQPDRILTRAEAVKIFNLFLGRTPADIPIAPVWPDVREDHWSYADIMEASISHRYRTAADGAEQWVR